MCDRSSDPSMHDSPTTCEAVIAHAPGPYGELALNCRQSVGLIRWTDTEGRAHAACREHVAERRHVSPEAVPAFNGASR